MPVVDETKEKETSLTQQLDYQYLPSLRTMATCHSIHSVEEGLIGDPLDLIMFEYTGWQLDELCHSEQSSIPTTEHSEQPLSLPVVATIVSPLETGRAPCVLNIHRRFEFMSGLCRMSVVVSEEGNNSPQLYVHCKGAPEVIKSLCIPSTLPSDYNSQLRCYTQHGYRVLALASKTLSHEYTSPDTLNAMKRESAECDLEFCGFIIFENKLKRETTPAIQVLKNAAIRQLICTGDNILTAISVARECGMIPEEHRVYVPKLADKTKAYKEGLDLTDFLWEDVDDHALVLDPVTLTPEHKEPHALAITGDMYTWLSNYAPKLYVDEVLTQCKVYARMSPEQKQMLVESYQDKGFCVGFCGDGANDCGALKAADVS
jgi:cation-transporting ATPase 13A3/4/5